VAASRPVSGATHLLLLLTLPACLPSVPLTAVCPLLQVKSDEHMAKVKEQLLYEKQQIEATDQR
jgi:hypothetical protein